MSDKALRPVWAALALAAVFWFIIFSLQIFNFWYAMGAATTLLALWALVTGGPPFRRHEWNRREARRGMLGAVVLYAVFWLGNHFSRLLFSFAGEQISSIYSNRTAAPVILIALLLALFIGPGEEIFWRGFVQRRFSARLGPRLGWLAGALVYAAVHAWSGNFILVMAALLSGLFWGWLFLRAGNIVPGIISHVLWDLTAFLVLPFH